MRVTADYAYFRLRDEGYTPDDIRRWAETIARDTAPCRDVFVYFKHEEEGKGPEFAQLLMDAPGRSATSLHRRQLHHELNRLSSPNRRRARTCSSVRRSPTGTA